MSSKSIDKAELIMEYSQQPLNSKYLRMVAHDIRNLMNTIMMANDILREDIQDVNHEAYKYTDMIRHASQDILTVLDAAVAAAVAQDNTNRQNDT